MHGAGNDIHSRPGYLQGLMNIMVIIICWAVVSVVCMTSNLTIKQTAP